MAFYFKAPLEVSINRILSGMSLTDFQTWSYIIPPLAITN
jgi:hypothetical protein